VAGGIVGGQQRAVEFPAFSRQPMESFPATKPLFLTILLAKLPAKVKIRPTFSRNLEIKGTIK
jgi:hypothetical protein